MPQLGGRGAKASRTKILVLGPQKSGKTAISNYLADSTETQHEYRPTKGVRIVEFESNDLELHGERVDADVELWDCSGDEKYSNCWPAIRNEAQGAILVANPDENSGTDLLPWFTQFVEKSSMSHEDVLVVLNEVGDSSFRLPPQMSGLACFASSIDHDGEALRLEFNSFLCSVISRNTDSRH